MLPADRLNQSANRAREKESESDCQCGARKSDRACALAVTHCAEAFIFGHYEDLLLHFDKLQKLCVAFWVDAINQKMFQNIAIVKKIPRWIASAAAAGPRSRHLFGLGVSERASERRARVVSHRKWMCAPTPYVHTHSPTPKGGREGRPTARGREGRKESCRIGAKIFTR